VTIVQTCSLCTRLRALKGSDAPLARNRWTTLFEGPFFKQWPGSLMLVSNRHVQEQTDLRPSHAREVWLDILDAERALRLTTGCQRVNFVKFGNVAAHLHWHLIPRYAEERHPTLTPWEILQAHPALKETETRAKAEAVYRERTQEPWHSQGLLVSREELVTREAEHFLLKANSRETGVFGAALFLRPKNAEERATANTLPLPVVLERARAEPAGWESFLMQRNYLDRSWDHFGGNGEPGEFPEETMRREVKEESGWEVGPSLEVTRQWAHGLLQGFLFLARPAPQASDAPWWMLDHPARTACDEVADARWFALDTLAAGHGVPESVAGRHRALLAGQSDFLVTTRV
jgi:diadenosine tetraphosphate (Ap4A) HIT family hydrolase/8-oxo-dGTP pyrophosphatase MutT (NUDIX family)